MRNTKQLQLKKELRDLYKSLDFVSRNFLNGRRVGKKESEAYYNIYQQLGKAWEFLGLQYRHSEGYKTTRDRNEVCKICGKVKGTRESFYVLPVEGRKRIGVKLLPNSKKVFPTRAKAQIINNALEFYGASLNVSVFNPYKSSLFKKHHDIVVAADRIVTLKERGVEYEIDQHMIRVRVKKRKRMEREFGGFAWEISRKHLKNFPVIFEFDNKHRFVGLTILG